MNSYIETFAPRRSLSYMKLESQLYHFLYTVFCVYNLCQVHGKHFKKEILVKFVKGEQHSQRSAAGFVH